MSAYLAAKGCPEDSIGRVVAHLVEIRLVDDRAFAHRWVETRLRTRKASVSRLRAELLRQGIDPVLAEEILAEISPAVEWENATAFAARRVQKMGGLAPEVARRRLVQALARRGFPGEVAYRVALDTLAKMSKGEPENLEPC